MRHLLQTLAATGLIALLAACGQVSTGGLVPALDGPLLRVEWRGGLCADGPCDTSLELMRDGTIRDALADDQVPRSVDPATFAELLAAIEAADLAAIRAVPFEDVCPVAFDGQEVIYTFFSTDPPTRIASCESALDPLDRLWVALEAVIARS